MLRLGHPVVLPFDLGRCLNANAFEASGLTSIDPSQIGVCGRFGEWSRRDPSDMDGAGLVISNF